MSAQVNTEEEQELKSLLRLLGDVKDELTKLAFLEAERRFFDVLDAASDRMPPLWIPLEDFAESTGEWLRLPKFPTTTVDEEAAIVAFIRREFPGEEFSPGVIRHPAPEASVIAAEYLDSDVDDIDVTLERLLFDSLVGEVEIVWALTDSRYRVLYTTITQVEDEVALLAVRP